MASAAALGAVLAWPTPRAQASKIAWTERRDLYPQGVASGDPTPDSVILWTRRPPPQNDRAPLLFVEVAEDEKFSRVVSTASILPKADNDWTVRVLAAGLKPATAYWYRFTDSAGQGSRIGRTLTAPGETDGRPVQFAFVSCQNQNLGASNAWRRIIFEDERRPSNEQLGFVLHLGDLYSEIVWYPEDKKAYYARTVRDILRYPHGEKHGNFHVPTDVEDYRTIFRAYLSDPNLADARARWPFVCIWDNHEFSWRGWQSYEDYGDGAFPAQSRKVAAAKAWFEYQPARVMKTGDQALDRFDAPKVSDIAATTFDDHGLSLEPNNLAAIDGLKLFRSMRWGRNVDLIITDNRSYRSQTLTDRPEAAAFDLDNFPAVFPLHALEVLDAGKSYDNGAPPQTIRFAGKDIPNWRRDEPAQSILGSAQKKWFFGKLRDSQAPWKLWGNTIGSLDARVDFQNLPKDAPSQWPDTEEAILTYDDWSGYRSERAEIFDFVRAGKITGFASLAGDRHAFFAGVLTKSLSPHSFDPVGVEFVTGSISAPGVYEALDYSLPKTHPMRAIYAQEGKDGAKLSAINLTTKHGVRASLALQQSGDLSGALAATNSGLAPHLSFIDWGGHGYTVVRADADTLQAEFVAIERPVAASATEDGGPLAYRARHRVMLWKPGEQPSLEQTIIEGSPPLST